MTITGLLYQGGGIVTRLKYSLNVGLSRGGGASGISLFFMKKTDITKCNIGFHCCSDMATPSLLAS